MTGAPAPDDAVVLHPPVEVVRPRAVDTLPAERGMRGGTQYSIKLDGFRCLVFARGARTRLQSRGGGELSDRMPEVAGLVAGLPAGLVLDGEICAWRDGRFAFSELLRTPATRAAAGVPVGYVAFDVLAVPGRDVRVLPLAERWDLLKDALAEAGSPVPTVLATTDRAEALDWMTALAPQGVEGLVAKALASAYRPGDRTAWVKYRRADTVDARLVGVVGPARRPRAVVVEFPDGTRAVSSPQLEPMAAREIAEVVQGRLGATVMTEDGTAVRAVENGPPVELRVGSGRHATVRFVRVRDPEA
ncbi:DNA ligase [Streptomyces sp. NPDC003077]|uniref:ATP-dependent DNA ligase n=1 Tax=Streptomyces sp. NPDC003077 TaxID=3154443 RepID=UPI0033AE55DD